MFIPNAPSKSMVGEYSDSQIILSLESHNYRGNEVGVSKDEGENRSKIRDNPAAAASFLSAAFKDNSLQDVVVALQLVLQAQNVKALAEFSGMPRRGLYKTFDGKTDPHLSRVLRLFDALDVRVVLEARIPKAKPPRPKLGRPRSK